MNTKSKLLSFGIFTVVLVLSGQASSAQGLKGAQMPKEMLGRLTYLPGKNDLERWKIFLDLQPKLIGMSIGDVCKHFGKDPIGDRDRSSIEYGLTQEPVMAGAKANSWLHLKVFFRNGVAWKYAVEAVQ